MEAMVAKVGHVSEEQAALVVEIARTRARLLGGTAAVLPLYRVRLPSFG